MLDNSVVRYTYIFDQLSKVISLKAPVVETHKSYGGTLFDSILARDFFVVSCADCIADGGAWVTFFDRETLEHIQRVEGSFEPQTEEPYHLAMYQTIDGNTLQLFIAGRSNIDLV